MLYRNTVFTSAKRLNHAFSRFVGNVVSVLPRISGVEVLTHTMDFDGSRGERYN